jgi:hypothetical protein
LTATFHDNLFKRFQKELVPDALVSHVRTHPTFLAEHSAAAIEVVDLVFVLCLKIFINTSPVELHRHFRVKACLVLTLGTDPFFPELLS